MRWPLRFHPFLRPLVWGGRALGDVLGKTLPSGDTYGESWEVSDHLSHPSVVADGPHAGLTLSELLRRDAVGLLGNAEDRFPWLVKFLDAHDWLSVQVHPSDENVEQLWPGERGKTEAWFVLAAQPGSRIYAGLRPGIGEPELRRAIDTGHAADCLHSFTPQPGDFLFLPAGTVHAVGGGVLFAEVQQSSDATFRLFDWNRVDALGKPRKLHIDEGLTCINYTFGPVHPIRAEGFPLATHSVLQPLVRCPYFELDFLRQSDPVLLGDSPRLSLAMVLHGTGTYQSHGETHHLSTGSTLLFPAQMDSLTIQPNGPLSLLVARMPM